MASRRNLPTPARIPPPSHAPPPLPTRQRPSDLHRGIRAAEIDWDKWARHIESRRRRLDKVHPFDGILTSREYLAEATYISFKLEGLDTDEADVAAALATGRRRRAFRSRQAQR